MGKAEENKQKKREALLSAAFNLFTSKGINNTSISEIAEKAGVAKGTYYLYFKDKYDINSKLMIHMTSRLVDNAMAKLSDTDITDFRDKLIFVINDIIDSLSDNKILLIFITKNLGVGFYRHSTDNTEINNDPQIHAAYELLIQDAGGKIENPELMMYMIIELVGGCIYSSILYNQPVPVGELKPHLFEAINRIIDQFTK